ncbi:MAG: hypothetical protein HYY93_05285 [Planctomycetes bacterium]|nr:hypothetical protein [Planctomycetota bacterium]
MSEAMNDGGRIRIEVPRNAKRLKAEWTDRYTRRRPFVSVLDALVPICVDSLREDEE